MDPPGLSVLNHPAKRLPGPSLLHELVQPASHAPALDYMASGTYYPLSYQQLHDAADSLADRISAVVGHLQGSMVVPLLLDQSPLLYISQLAVLKAGGAFCPLNTDAPPERVRFILQDVSAAVILVSKGLVQRIPHGISCAIITVDNEDGETTEYNSVPIRHRVPDSGDLAYVMYTSGSTGTPKGVGVSHDAATQALLAHDRQIPTFRRFLQFAAPTFDVSVFEIFFPLFRGSTLIAVHRIEMLNDLPAVLQEMRVDACELTPTVAGSLLRKRSNAPQLKLLLTIGEMLNAPVVEEFGGDENRPSMLWAMYGPTEATIHCTLQTSFSSSSPIGNIGVPLDTVSCFIIEATESSESVTNPKVLPIGEVGELAVGGYQLASGYLNRPEQTQAVFISSAYGPIYRTGDKARLRTDGTLECLGRLSDNQVKLRGQRLELGEVEQAVLRTPGCHSAAAAVVDSTLVAFCAADTGLAEADVTDKCREWLPQYMIPGDVVLMTEFPRLPSGKIDRKRLKEDYQERRHAGIDESTRLASTDEIEAKVVDTVSEVLGIRVGKSTDLTSAGLDSLRAIKLTSALQVSGFKMNSTDLISMKRVSDIVFAVRRLPPADSGQPTGVSVSLAEHLMKIRLQNAALDSMKELIEDIIPCIPLQSAMLAETAQDPTAYCNMIELDVPLEYAAEQLAGAFRELARCNEILRTGFTTWEGEFVAVLFTDLQPGQIAVVDNFQHSFKLSDKADYLRPLRLQIRKGTATTGARLLLHLHHALYDGWSMDILLSDLSEILRKVTIPPRISFREVSTWYKTGLDTNYADSAKVFWTEHLLGYNKIPPPKLHSRITIGNQIGSSEKDLLVCKSQLEPVIRRIGCSSQALFQATLILLWSGITGSSDVVIGSVTSGRSIPVTGIEGAVGPCIASLPLRCNLGSMTAIRDVLNHIHSSNRSLMRFCALSLSDVKKIAALQPGESLYDVLFVYQESLYSQTRVQNLVKERRHLDRLETPLLFEVEPRENGFNLRITYRLNLFTSEMVDHFIEQFNAVSHCLLEHIEGDIQSVQKQLSVSSSIYNPLPLLWKGTSDLGRAFEAIVAQMPTRTAICFVQSLDENGARTIPMSYADLNGSANSVAHYLRAAGASTGQVVAIVMEKSPMLYVSILGIVKAGCAYLPILPSTPAARVRDILSQAKVEHCVVDDSALPNVASVQNVSVTNISTAPLSEMPTKNLDLPVDLSRLAYIIFTSGTTGTPKGVAITHDNIMANISHLLATYTARPESPGRLLQSCSQAFDVSVFEIFFTWHAGMCLCAGINDVILGDLEYAIRELEITHLSMTPTVASLVDPQRIPSVKFIVTAGEAMTQPVADRWLGRLWQGYGPSETTNICTVKHMSKNDHIEHLGHVLPNTSCFVLLPESLDLAPIGWVGEFCFGGQQLAQGYLNMPDLTKEKFISHPRYGRLYRSGDIGRMLSDGSLMILGRLDNQIKLRGQRIDTGEINNIATSTGAISAAISVLVCRQRKAPEQLALFYVPSDEGGDFQALTVPPETHQMLFATLYSRLPTYMIPSYLIPISMIPLTPSGKVDYDQLKTCFQRLSPRYLETTTNTSGHLGEDSDWNDIEVSIADTIARSTGIPRSEFGRWTPLTILGIDSISAIGLARKLSSQIDTRVPVSAILRHSTVAQLARYLEKGPRREEDTAVVQFFTQPFVDKIVEDFRQQSLDVSKVLPCTPLQEAMLSRGQKNYYNKILLRLHVNPEQMKGYWEVMTRRHDILRTCFIATDNAQHAIAQVVLEGWSIPWSSFHVDQPSFDGAVQEHLGKLPEPIDTKIPPISLAIFHYRGSAFLSIICHHALYDGVAMGNLWKEVESLATGTELAPPASYDEFLHMALTLPNDIEKYWTGHFREYHPSSLFGQPTSSAIDQCTHSTSLDIPLSEINTKLRHFGASLLATCQASWANILAIAHKRPDVCFGCVVNGRTLDVEGLDRLVAPCFNTIPIRTDTSSHLTSMDLVKYLQKLNTELLPYQFTPLRLVQRIFNRKHGQHLFDTLLLLQKPLQDIDARIWTLEEDSGDMDIPLICEIIPCPNLNSIIVNIHYDMSIVTGSIAGAFADMFKHQFATILGSPYSSLTSLEKLPTTLGSVMDKLQPKEDEMITTDLFEPSQECWSAVEMDVQKVLSALSGVAKSKIHRSTTIFQLGLDSINAVQVASILRKQGYSISSSEVIECPTCAKIAAKLDQNASKKLQAELPAYDFRKFTQDIWPQLKTRPVNTDIVEAVLPCTRLQSAMLNSFIQSGDQYLNAMSYVMDPGVKLEDVVHAWEALQKQHPMLRTGFVPANHRDASFAMIRYQAASTSLPLRVDKLDCKSLDLNQMRTEIGRRLKDSLHTPPFQITLVSNDKRLAMYIVMHHALYDAQSLQFMMGDLSSLLRNRVIRAPHEIEPAVSSILTKSLESNTSAKEFWEANSSQVVVNKFPVMTPLHVTTRSVLSETIVSCLSFSELQQASKVANASIQAIIQAAWTRVLASYLGESSVVFGMTLSGRTTDEAKDAPFPCINTVPVISHNQSSNADLVGSIMMFNQQLHKHQFAPLSQVQKWLGYPTGGIFDTLLAYQKMETTRSADVPWQLVAEEAVVEYPVSLEVEPSGEVIHIRTTHYDDILPKEQAYLMMHQFDAALRDISCNPMGYEDDTYAKRSELLSILPAESPSLDTPVQLLHQFVERGATLHPNKTALEYVNGFDGEYPVKRIWTYHELNCMGNKVAKLVRSKTSPGSIVAIHFDKCPEAYFSILGILKAGCSFVALDPGAPGARKQFIVGDSKTPCLLTTSRELIDFKINVPIITINEEDLAGLDGCLGLDPVPELVPPSTCYCLYTSGTTGTPKGCEITHENAVQAMMAFQKLFKGHWDENSRWLQFAALHFDVSVLEQYWSWSVGMAVIAAPKDLILDDLTATINRLDITHIDLTPSLARLTHPDEVPSLCRGVFITGGEQLKQEILDAWGPKGVIYNAYGPTEATIGVTMYQRVPITGRPSNIGKQFPNVGSFVFRPGTEAPVVRGAVGELCVSGRLVGKGYLNRPELTNERFPTLAHFGERIYRTGDLVRVLHDGCFDFLGRIDDQVKLRGQRLELAEINHAIRAGVTEVHDVATVVTGHGASGKDVLVSFIVSEPSRSSDLRILHDHKGLSMRAKEACRARLPGYMVPTYFFTLPRIPLSPNNKVEVKDLRRLFAELSHEQLMELSSGAREPVSQTASQVMRKILQILADFCETDTETLSSSTSIFDVGLDSITATRLSTRLKSEGFRSASTAILLQNPVIVDLSNALAKSTFTNHDDSIREVKQAIKACAHRHRTVVCRELNVRPPDIEYIAPCSPLQQGIVSRTLTSEEKGFYFNSFELVLENGASTEQIKMAWDMLIKSEAILRTAFVSTTDGFVQAALRNRQIPWKELSLGDCHSADQALEEARQNWIYDNASSICDPLRLMLINVSGCRRLIIYIHHAIYDGNSFGLMLDRVQSGYEGKTVSRSPSFVEALTHGPLWNYSYSHPFWTHHLHEWKFKPIPRLSLQSGNTSSLTTRTVSARLLELARSTSHVTLQAVVLALWVSVLHKYVSRLVTVGVVVSGRSIDLENVENTIGPLFNTVPFFSRAHRQQTWASLIHRCHEFNIAVLGFQHMPLKDIQKSHSGGKPLFDNLFAFQIEGARRSESSAPWRLEDSHTTPDYPLALEAVFTQDGHLRLTLASQSHIADSSKLEEILDCVEQSVSVMAKNPDAAIGSPNLDELGEADTEADAIPQPSSQRSGFIWTERSLDIREEISLIADATPDNVTEETSILGLGLDSIDVIKLSAKLKRRNILIAPSQIMRCQTIEKMIQELEHPETPEQSNQHFSGVLNSEKRKLWEYLEESGLDMTNIEMALPPTPLQQSMVAVMIQSNFESYFNHDILEIADEVDIQRLQDAWTEVVNQTPILRTGFVEVNGPQLDMAYCQVVSRPQGIKITHVQLEGISEVRRLIEEAKSMAMRSAATKDLLQIRFVTIASRRLVVLSIAHALYDGWSLGLLYKNLQAAYEGRSVASPTVEVYLSRLLRAENTDAKEFWAQYLDGAPPTILPPELELVNDCAAHVEFAERPSEIDMSGVIGFCRKHAISLQVLCQACWGVLLAHRSKRLDVTFGTVMSGRDFAEAEDLVFPTMNTIALRCILHSSPSEFLRYLEDNMRDIRDFQSYPLHRAQLHSDAQGQGLFNTLFILQKSPSSAASKPLLKSIEGSSAVEYPICIEAELLNECLVWRAACQHQYTSHGEPSRLIADLDQVLQFLVTYESSSMLSADGNSISICGLPSITLMEDATPASKVANDASMRANESWSDTACAIRDVLHQVSSIPVSKIALSNTLYHLGLDSISAIKVSSLLRKRGIELRPQELIRASSIQEMAEPPKTQPQSGIQDAAREEQWTPSGDLDIGKLLTSLGLQKRDIQDILPALPMQVYMLSTWQNTKGSLFYPEFFYCFDATIELQTVQAAWKKLVAESPMLRTMFIATGSTETPFLQIITKYDWTPDIQSPAEGGLTGVVQPLAVPHVTRHDSHTWVLRLKIHHALYDGVSLPALLHHFSCLLGANGLDAKSGQVSSGWKRFAMAAASEARRGARKKFWTSYLQDCAHLSKQPKGPKTQVTERTWYLKRSAVTNMAGVRMNAAQHGISVQAMFLAAYARVLAAAQHSSTVVFGIYLANRAASHDEELPAEYPTLNLVPLKVHVAARQTLVQAAVAIQGDIHAIGTDGRADVGLWEIYAWTGVKVDSFVNFLAFPNTSGPIGDGVPLVPVESTEENTSELGNFATPAWLTNNAVKDDYPEAVDIEASMHESSLDMGVFGSRQRVTKDGAAGLVADIVACLKEADSGR